MSQLRLGEILVSNDEITPEQQVAARSEQIETKMMFGECLQKIGATTEQKVNAAVAFQKMCELPCLLGTSSDGEQKTHFYTYLAANAADKQLVALKAAVSDKVGFPITTEHARVFIASGGAALYYFRALQWHKRACEIVTTNYAVAYEHTVRETSIRSVQMVGDGPVDQTFCRPSELNERTSKELADINLFVFGPTFFNYDQGPGDEDAAKRAFRQSLINHTIEDPNCRVLFLLDRHKLSRYEPSHEPDWQNDGWNQVLETLAPSGGPSRLTIISTACAPADVYGGWADKLKQGEHLVNYAYNERRLRERLGGNFVTIPPPTSDISG